MTSTLDLPRDAVDSAIEKALGLWQEVTPLTFSRADDGEADIKISFAVRGKTKEKKPTKAMKCINLSRCYWGRVFQRDLNYLSFQ